MPSALVLTGEMTLDVLRSHPKADYPTWAIERVDEALPQAVWDRHGWTTRDE